MDDSEFEIRVKEVFGITVQETRVFVRIADKLKPELRQVLKGTCVENDVDALLVLTRLSPEQQDALVFHLGFARMDAEFAVEAVAQGALQRFLQ